jgi:heme/copper-type cytochrome/quinol oxidase subunit 2
MWRSLLLGKLAISIVVSLLIGGYSIWRLQQPDFPSEEYYSWLSVGVFFLVLAAVQLVMIAVMFRKKKFD